MSNNNDEPTQIVPGRNSGEYDESRDFDMSKQQYDPETMLDDDTRQYQESMLLENLPSTDREGQHWVRAHRYEEIYDQVVELQNRMALLDRNYHLAYDQNNMLRSNNEQLTEEINSIRQSSKASQSYTDEKEAELNAREEVLDSRDRNFAPLKTILIVLASVATIAALVFGLMWMDQRSDSVSTGARDSALQEQVRTLRESLEAERSDHDETRGKVGELNTQVGDLQTQLDDRTAAEENARAEIENRDAEIDRLVGEIDNLNAENDRLANQPAETVTRTYVQRSPGDTQTITETATATATVTTTAPSTTN